ncbi:MAG TPA: CHRD domain-containing protein [Blastocatellia bacterium]|nr:CHRD domain-containing protein [Blastocatellia bacterium]
MRRSVASVVLMALTVVAVALMMMRSARADIVTFTAQLLASNEVPPVSNADSAAFGQVLVTLDTSNNNFRFDWSVNNVAAPALILSHIHEAAAGVNGPVRIDSLLSPANPVPVVNGSAVFSRGNLPGPADVVQRLLANPSGFYFNIHSTLNPGGVVRGQLVRQAASAEVPTLSEWGAILMGLIVVAACVFFLTGRKSSMALAAGASMPAAQKPMKAIDLPLLGKVTLYVEAGIVLALIVWSPKPVDVAGAITSGLVVAFIIHLLIVGARRR